MWVGMHNMPFEIFENIEKNLQDISQKTNVPG